jgi:hypothetical protein
MINGISNGGFLLPGFVARHYLKCFFNCCHGKGLLEEVPDGTGERSGLLLVKMVSTIVNLNEAGSGKDGVDGM